MLLEEEEVGVARVHRWIEVLNIIVFGRSKRPLSLSLANTYYNNKVLNEILIT